MMSGQGQKPTQVDFSEQLIAVLPRLRRYAYGLCRNRALADDLVQSACERAIAARESWQAGTKFEAWAFRIVRNLWIDGLRHTKVAGPQEDIDESFDLQGSDGRKDQEAKHFLQQVERAMLALPAEMREVMMLVCVEEQSYKEAAEILGIPVGTVMSRLARARVRLSELTGYRSGEDDE